MKSIVAASSGLEEYKKKFRKKYYQYLRKDCELLYRIYIEFRKEINDFEPIGELGYSAGSTSLRTFRRWMADHYKTRQIFSVPFEFSGIATKALRGGLTMYIGDGKHKNHLYENVNHYDVISMYPSVMRFVPVPISPIVYTDKVVKDYDQYRPGWYLCDFEQMCGRVPFLYDLEGDYPVWKGQGILNHFELRFLEQYGKFKVMDGVVFENYMFPFKKFFDYLLPLRMEAKAKKEMAKAHALKILANSLYGKFGQKPQREIIAITSDMDWYADQLDAILRNHSNSHIAEYVVADDYVIYGVESFGTAFSNRLIGAFVTSLARLKLGMLLNTIPSIYCDTDSIFTQARLDDYFVGSQPGDFEEGEKSPSSMICLGKKSYQYGDDIKFKGVPAKHLTPDDMIAMRFDIDVEVEYKSPTAWRTAMRNQTERPNEFLSRKRRVKRGKSLAELGMLRTSGEFFEVDETKDFLTRLLSF